MRMSRPQRITYQRVKGFDLQGKSQALNGLPAKMVTRPGRWGNPFEIKDVAKRFKLEPQAAHDKAIELHRAWMEGTLDTALKRAEPFGRALDGRAYAAPQNAG